jgi:dihydroorotate dehydrogenase (fumarate)
MAGPDLSTRYLGLELSSPLVASSSPLTRDLDSLRRLEDAGAGAVVLPSLFEEEIAFESQEVDRMLETHAESFAEATSFFPELEDYAVGPDRYLELVRNAVESLDIPVIASLNGVTSGGWLEYGKIIEQAGAHAIELNPYRVAADPATTAESIEADDRELVRQLRSSLEVPLSVKLSPYFTALAHTARELADAGADGLTLFNRFYQPDLDLEELRVEPRLELSSPHELLLPLRWVAILHGRVDASLAASTGVHSADDALKVLLAGADVAMLASALLERGAGHLAVVRRGIETWLEEHEYESVAQLRGSVSARSVPDPEAYERANYRKTLRSYSNPHPTPLSSLDGVPPRR